MREPFDFTNVFLLIVIRTKGILISMALRTSGLLLSLTVIALAAARIVFADESGSPADLQRLRREIKQLQSDETAQRRRMDQNEQLIKELETQLRQVESQNQKLNNAAQQLVSSDAKLKSETNERLEQFQAQLGTDASPGGFSEAMSRYLGTHQFTFVGAAAGDFIYDRNTSQNTFSLQFEPIALYRLNDWILFEGTINALLPVGSKSDFELPVATAQIFLNDYLEINAGIFDQPFGDWLEDQSPLWVNRFITAPLLYGA